MSEKQLAGRVAVVTGASRGIGSAVAMALAQAGALLVVNFRDDERGAAQTVHLIEAAGGRSVAVRADVRSPAEAADLMATASSAFDAPVGILVNNAGVIPNSRGWTAETPQTLTDAFLTNAAAAVFCAQACLPDMKRQGWGRIVNVSSIYGTRPVPAVLSYSMSKAALDSVTKALSVDCTPFGITVNSVAPGNIDTAMTRRAGEEYICQVENRTPAGRLGKPAEVATAVVYLCTADFISGATVMVDGALSAAV